jgi:hypothetical protein
MDIDWVVWDWEEDPDGNVQHIAEHGLRWRKSRRCYMPLDMKIFWSVELAVGRLHLVRLRQENT